MAKRRLLLVGGGHTHVQVVRACAADPPPDTEVVLISTARMTPYSGMLPGLIAGHYTHREAHIDLGALCKAAGVAFIEQQVCSIDPDACLIKTASGERHGFDILSADTGSVPPLDRIPGAAEHGIPVKPVERFLRAIEALDASADAGQSKSIAVVGAGAAGFEVALALDHRLRRRLSAPRPELCLYTDADTVLPEMPPRVRGFGMQVLERQGIEVRTRCRVTEVAATGIGLDDGRFIEAGPVCFVNGAAPSPMYREAGLDTDDKGFVAVRPTLQSTSHANVFACGDAASVLEHPRPKAGVFAVRQGPPLIENLRRTLDGKPLQPFVPQRKYLVLLSTGGKHAIATRNGFAIQGRWVWRWKDHIDRGFMAGFLPEAVAKRQR